MVKKYIPKQGDIVYIGLNPTKKEEQKGFRPAIVISNNIFNEKTHISIICPITSNEKASNNDLLGVNTLMNACIEE